jgi:prevent-host-death family protein
MNRVSFTEFRNNASVLLSKVEEGETLLVTRHGRPIAEVSPYKKGSRRRPSWKDPALRLKVKGGSLAKAILEERELEDLF